MRRSFALIFLLLIPTASLAEKSEGLPLWYYRHPSFDNFGDVLSLKIVERIVGGPVIAYKRKPTNNIPKLMALGSILHIAADNDVIWGTGVNGKDLARKNYIFQTLDVRAVRGPLTCSFLVREFGINCPKVFGDPALLVPYLFPEFKKKANPRNAFLIVPHYSDAHLYPKEDFPNVAYPWEPWDEIIERILDSEFVVASSLHGVIVAEAFGIPARLLRISESEPLFKFTDYYLGTNRPDYKYATSVDEALSMGGEAPIDCDVKKLYEAFPFEFWPSVQKKELDFPN